jgi:hypothetical protein
LTGILLGKGGSSLFNKLQPIEVGAVGAHREPNAARRWGTGNEASCSTHFGIHVISL